MSDDSLTANELALYSMVVNTMRSFGNRAFHSGGDVRDIEAECKYPPIDSLTAEDYRELHDKFGIAERVNFILSDETWNRTPELFEDFDDTTETDWELAWKELGQSLSSDFSPYAPKDNQAFFEDEESSPIWDSIYTLDRLCGIGRYGVLLLGFSSGELQDPLPGFEDERFKPRKKSGKPVGIEVAKPGSNQLLYLQAYDESLVKIATWEGDRMSSRYGQPIHYLITLSDPTVSVEGVGHDLGYEVRVHWSRIIHAVDNNMSSRVYGVPRSKSVYYQLLDLRKLYGGSAEMYWQGAFPGISFETHPQLGNMVKLDPEAMKKMVSNYFEGLQRYLATTGATAKTLSPQVVDPSQQIERQLDAICVKLGIPKRIFMGSERGELASSQDSDAHDQRINRRRTRLVTPRFIQPFATRLIRAGVLPIPKELHASWDVEQQPTPLEVADIAAKRMGAISAYIQAGADVLIPPLTFLTEELGYDREHAEKMLEEAEEIAEEKAEEEAEMAPPAPPVPGVDPNAQAGPEDVTRVPTANQYLTANEGIWHTTKDGSKIFITDGGEVRAGGPDGPVISKEGEDSKDKPLPRLSRAEALDLYSGTDKIYAEANNYLRGVNKDISDRGKQLIQGLDDVFAENEEKTESTLKVYRGMDPDLLRRLGAAPEDFGPEWWTFPGFKPDVSELKGKVIEDKGFMSTSTRKEEAAKYNEQTQLVLSIPKGTSVVTTGFKYDEAEVLLNRGSKMQITGVKVKVDSEGDWSAVISAKLVNDYKGPTVNIRSKEREGVANVASIDFVANNCGIGPGGFQPGNTCAKGGGGGDTITLVSATGKDVQVDILSDSIGGSTGAKLVSMDGTKYVLKTGKSAEHALSEYNANRIYFSGDANASLSTKLKGTDGTQYILNDFIEGKPLSETSGAEREAAIARLQEDFALDATLANWDVIGSGMDNIIVDENGEPHRIDNGGALAFRAQGGPKSDLWNGENTELETMRNNPKNPSAVAVFGSMTDEQVVASINKMLDEKEDILNTAAQVLWPKDYAILESRIDAAEAYRDKLLGNSGAAATHTWGPSNGKDFVAELTSKAEGLSDNKNFIAKFEFLNPHGIHNGEVLVPQQGAPNNPQNAKNLEALKQILPEGTAVKIVGIAPSKDPSQGPWKGANKEVQAKLDALYGPNASTSGKSAQAVAQEVTSGSKPQASTAPKAAGHPLDDGKTIKTLKAGSTTQPGDVEYGTEIEVTANRAKNPTEDQYVKFDFSLTDKELTAISQWKGGHSTDYRKNIEQGKLSESHLNFFSALEKAPDFEGTLYRGVHGKFAKEQMDLVMNQGIGGLWLEHSPTGGSKNTTTGVDDFSDGKLLFKYSVSKAADISKIEGYAREEEVVIRPQSIFRIKRIIRNGKVSQSSQFSPGWKPDKPAGPKDMEMIVELEQVK